MMVMVSNQTGEKFDTLADRYYPYGLIGHLYSPEGLPSKPQRRYPYAIDNFAFSSWKNGIPWDAGKYLDFCDKVATFDQLPMWAVVPDVVTNREATIENWKHWAKFLRKRYKWRLAFAVQDGMTVDDVPYDHDTVFVGGSMTWKLNTLEMWCQTFASVHVARINRPYLLWRCQELGAESVDGTGWWHTLSGQYQGLCEWCECNVSGDRPSQHQQALNLWD